MPVDIAFPLGLLVGIACGYVNGALVTLLKLPPFIVTLGTWSIFGALVLFYSQQRDDPPAGHRGGRARSCSGRATAIPIGGSAA